MTSPASPVLEERATLNVTIECGPKTRGSGAEDAHQTHGKAPHLHHQKQEGCSNGTGLERGEEELRRSGRGRKRQRKTSEQVTILEAHFVANPLPDKALRDRLGLQLGLTTRQIQIWFQNKRAKAKQEHLLKPPTSHTTEAPPHLLPANTGQIVNASSAVGTSSTTKRKRPEPSETATPSVATTTSKHSPAAAPTRTAMGIAANTEPVPMSSNSPASPLQAQPHFSANRAAGRVVCHHHYSHQHQSHQLRPFLNQHQHKRHHSQAQPLCRPSGVHCHHHPQQKKQPPPLHHLLLNTPQPMWTEGNVGSTTSSFSSPIEHVLTDHDLLLLGTDEPQRLDDGKSPGQACLELELQSLLLEYLEKDMVN